MEPSQDTDLHSKLRARAEKAADDSDGSEVTGRIIHVIFIELSGV